MRYRFLIVLVFVAMATACGTGEPTTNVPANSARDSVVTQRPINSSENKNSPSSNASVTKSGHEHTAPHGGTLIVFGKEFAHLEIVLDPVSGQITAYALDGEAEKAVKIAQDSIFIEVEGTSKFSIRLDAVENSLTGERRGATSEFRGQSDQLKGVSQFDGEINSLTIRGRKFNNMDFNFPKGNEDRHSH